MRRIGWITLALALLTMSEYGCKLGALDDTIVVPDVEDEFYVEMREGLEPGYRYLQLNIMTIQDEECLNSTIDYNFLRDGSRLDVSINNIIQPVDCEPGTAPAQSLADLGGLQGGFYEMGINLKNTVFNTGQLVVNGGSYYLNMDTEHGIILLREELRRVPDFSIWGYISYDREDERSVAESFISDLEAVTQEQDAPVGYYGYFNISNDVEPLVIEDQPAGTNVIPFLYLYEGDEPSLRDLVDSYREDYPDLLTIKLMKWDGREL